MESALETAGLCCWKEEWEWSRQRSTQEVDGCVSRHHEAQAETSSQGASTDTLICTLACVWDRALGMLVGEQ